MKLSNPWSASCLTVPLLSSFLVSALPYDPAEVNWNLNQNASATNPLDYWGEWPHHTYQPSPDNWRFPFYTIFLDRFVNGDPTNDDANGTQWEHDLTSNQFRHGGDVLGLLDTFDYLQGMGIKVGEDKKETLGGIGRAFERLILT
jgi:alpha-1,3-glucan synthase